MIFNNNNNIILIIIIGIIAISNLCSSTFNPYPRYAKKYTIMSEGGGEQQEEEDPGKPLFLSPYIKNGDIITARKLAEIDHPEMSRNVTSYSGYITVNAEYNSNLFFWYFRAANAPETAPVILWLQGGPGASSLFGLFTENGPFIVQSKKSTTASGEQLKLRKYSWHLNHHLIYIDNPVGTGFSFTDNESGYARNEKDVGQNLYECMIQFYQLFPELQENPFFITGESYAGKYIPALGHTIFHMNKKLNENRDDDFANNQNVKKINLQGLAIGNGLSDPRNQLKYSDYLYQLGLIDLNGQRVMHEYEKRGVDCINRKDFECAFNVFDELINMDQLPYGSLFKNLTGFSMYFNYLRTNADVASDQLMGDFLQAAATRKAIHVGNNTFHDTDVENHVEQHLKLDVMDSVADWVSELLSHYKMVIYNGQLDIIVAYPLTESYLQKLKFNGSDEYKTAARMIWQVDGEVAGYVKHAGNLTEILIRNAGHMAPADQPKWVLDMLLRFTSGKRFF